MEPDEGVHLPAAARLQVPPGVRRHYAGAVVRGDC